MLSKVVESNGPFFLTVFILMSLTAVALIIWRFLLNLFAKTDLETMLQDITHNLDNGGPKAVYDYCTEEQSMIPKLFRTAIEHGKRGRVAARNAMAAQIELEIMPALNFLLPYILVLAKVAPMVGLLGTVVGMIGAFDALASGATSADKVGGQIGMALFTTAEGLIIAIPLIFFYSYFRQRVQKFEVDLQRGAAAALELLPRLFKQSGQ